MRARSTTLFSITLLLALVCGFDGEHRLRRDLGTEDGDGAFGEPIAAVPAQPDSADAPVTSTLPFGTIRTSRSGNITRAVFDNGPINIMNWDMIRDLKNFTDSMKNQSHTKVVVFESANPSFFIAQLSLLRQPGDPTPVEQTKTFIQSAFDMSTMPVIYIASIAGRARGAGNELILQTDLRYAARGRTFMGNFESSIGLVPGAGGMAYLVKLTGRAKALEYVLSGRDIDADSAERIGWVNHSVDQADLDAVVGAMAKRLALFPIEALATAKRRINDLTQISLDEVMGDYNAWTPLVPLPAAQALVAKEQQLSNNESYGPYQLYEGQDVLRLYD